jgi:hypothetical protein
MAAPNAPTPGNTRRGAAANSAGEVTCGARAERAHRHARCQRRVEQSVAREDAGQGGRTHVSDSIAQVADRIANRPHVAGAVVEQPALLIRGASSNNKSSELSPPCVQRPSWRLCAGLAQSTAGRVHIRGLPVCWRVGTHISPRALLALCGSDSRQGGSAEGGSLPPIGNLDSRRHSDSRAHCPVAHATRSCAGVERRNW